MNMYLLYFPLFFCYLSYADAGQRVLLHFPLSATSGADLMQGNLTYSTTGDVFSACSGSCLMFRGIVSLPSYVSFYSSSSISPCLPSFPSLNSSMSLTFWYRFESGGGLIWWRSREDLGHGLEVTALNTGQVSAIFGNVESDSHLVSETRLAPFSWHHVSLVRTNQVIQLYLDGVLEGEEVTHNLTSFCEPFRLGVSPKLYHPFRGYMSDLRFYNTTLSNVEIASLATERSFEVTGLLWFPFSSFLPPTIGFFVSSLSLFGASLVYICYILIAPKRLEKLQNFPKLIQFYYPDRLFCLFGICSSSFFSVGFGFFFLLLLVFHHCSFGRAALVPDTVWFPIVVVSSIIGVCALFASFSILCWSCYHLCDLKSKERIESPQHPAWKHLPTEAREFSGSVESRLREDTSSESVCSKEIRCALIPCLIICGFVPMSLVIAGCLLNLAKDLYLSQIPLPEFGEDSIDDILGILLELLGVYAASILALGMFVLSAFVAAWPWVVAGLILLTLFSQLLSGCDEEKDSTADSQHAWYVSPSSVRLVAGVEGILGRGAFGVIRKGFVRLGLFEHPIAVKKVMCVGEDQKSLVAREIEIMMELNSRNLVRFYGCWFESDLCHVVMELCDREVKKWMKARKRKHSLSILDRLEVLLGIAQGIRDLHESNICHRDLKPANIMIREGVPKLVDFGLSRHRDTLQTRDALGGTPGFLPPSFEGDKTKIDIYAFGIVAWELLSDRVAYQALRRRYGDDPLGLERVIHDGGVRPALDELPQDVPLKIRELIHQAWSPLPADRPDAGSVVKTIEETVSSLSTMELKSVVVDLPLSQLDDDDEVNPNEQ